MSGLGQCEMRENGWPLVGVIADHVLSRGGKAELAFIGEQLVRGLAVVAFSDPLVWA